MVTMNRVLFLVSTLVVFLTACSNKKTKDSEALKEKIFSAKGEGWKSKVAFHSVKGMNYRAVQVPLQYYFLKNGSTDPQIVDSLYQEHKSERVVEFEFSNLDQQDVLKSDYTEKDYTSSVEYMAFKIKNDFVVETNSGKTIKCSGVTFERNFNIAPFKRIMLFFSGIPENDNIKLIYEDKLYRNGLFKFNFKETPIKL